VQRSVNAVKQAVKIKADSCAGSVVEWTGSAVEVGFSQEEERRSRAREDSGEEERMAREVRSRRESGGAHLLRGLQGGSGRKPLLFAVQEA